MSALTRRQFFKRGSLGAIAATCLPFSNISIIPGFDLIIKNGKIIDGTGNPIWNADIGIIGDTIAAIGQIPAQQGRKLIDASGYNVCPGFIDIHSHSDSSILSYPNAESRIYQGITTEVTGNCGYSAAPKPEDSEKIQLEEDNQKKWTDVASYFSQLESTGIAVNHALLLGHGTLRGNEVGMVNRSLTSSELKNILTAVECGMDQGAFGISTGLEYAPGQFTPTEEIVTLARLVARRDGLYATHIRNEEATLLAAINEAIEISQDANVRLEISHLKAAGRPNWKKQQSSFHLIESARRSDIRVFEDG